MAGEQGDGNKGFTAASSGGGDHGEPAGIHGAEAPGPQSAKANWGCILSMVAAAVIIAIVYAIWRG